MSDATAPNNFLHNIIADDLDSGKHQNIVTRFPPEPNGYLHIGHAKSIVLNFSLAQRFGGQCNLRFDDTNPEKESQEYVDSIKRDVTWLGYEWAGEVRFTSDYFDQLHAWAIELINKGLAYVCDLSPEQAREYRGSLTSPGTNSPYRERSVQENLALFERMRAGEFNEGSCALRAKIDMASPNMNMRDPILYRIKKVAHHHTGDKWCIYPSYDFAHGQSDAIEGITHSICTLEFADHRPLYEWFLANLPVPAMPKQYEFGRLNLNYTVTSKRKLKSLVDGGFVDGWDDPRMPTISGMRRRGVTAQALRKFCEMIGVTKSDGVVDVAMLEHAIRDDLDKNAPRAMCVLRPLKVTLTNLAESHEEWLTASGHPNRDDLPERRFPITQTIFIDADDFRVEANKKYKRLVLGKRVRLRNAYVIEAEDYVTDAEGNVTEVKARAIENTIGLDPEDGVKPKGVIQWVSAIQHATFNVRLYDRLFTCESPDADDDYTKHLNPDSLLELSGCVGEIGLLDAEPEQAYQFEREGYFCRDNSSEELVFNRTIGLRDVWENKG
jgi:glutaminyl-tRNA synthetase